MWEDRCFAVCLSLKPARVLQTAKPEDTLLVIGLHHKPGSDISDTIHSIRVIIKRGPKGVRVLVIGDWNLDALAI
jgi:hypothetical protein